MPKSTPATPTPAAEPTDTSSTDDITATADAHSTFDPETIGDDDVTTTDLAANRLDDDLASQNSGSAGIQTQGQEQGAGTASESFAPVGSSTVDAAPDGTPTPAPEAAPAPEAPAPAVPVPLPSPSEVVDTVKEKAGDAKVAVGQAADQAKQAAGQAADQVKAQASEAFTQTKQAASEAFGKAKESVVSQLESQLDRATDSLGGLTAALRQTGDQFRGNGVPFVPDYADQFAGQLDRVSAYLKDNDVEKLASDAEAFARRNPALFIGGAFLLGIGVARFLKASGTKANSYNPDNLPARLSDVSPPGGAPGRERLDIVSDSALPTGKVITAHGYVPGGVAGGGA